LPPLVTATTGLDALTQLIEPYVSSRANPLTNLLCLEGIWRIVRSLRTAFQDGQNLEARSDMSLASLMGGLALANAGLGAVHGLAGPIGGMFPAPHGAVCAALLPHIIDANLRALRLRQPHSRALLRYRELAALLTGHPEPEPEQAADWVRELLADLRVPGLATYGMNAEHAPQVAEKAAQASSMKANPLPLTPAELILAFQAAL
jgi:alcohol dehydrogenase class IV